LLFIQTDEQTDGRKDGRADGAMLLRPSQGRKRA
jgi:hypothetical protein